MKFFVTAIFCGLFTQGAGACHAGIVEKKMLMSLHLKDTQSHSLVRRENWPRYRALLPCVLGLEGPVGPVVDYLSALDDTKPMREPKWMSFQFSTSESQAHQLEECLLTWQWCENPHCIKLSYSIKRVKKNETT